MEIAIFFSMTGLLVACALIMIGVVIADVKAIYQRKLHDDHSDSILPDRDTDLDNNAMGNNHKEEHNRCDMGQGCYLAGKITAPNAINALETIRREAKNGLTQTEKDAIDYGIECIDVRYRLQKHINDVRNSDRRGVK